MLDWKLLATTMEMWNNLAKDTKNGMILNPITAVAAIEDLTHIVKLLCEANHEGETLFTGKEEAAVPDDNPGDRTCRLCGSSIQHWNASQTRTKDL